MTQDAGRHLFLRSASKPWPKPYKTPEAAFLQEEMQAFIERNDERARERRNLLSDLQIPPKELDRLYELCFIPGILFTRVLVNAKWHEKSHQKVVKEQQRLQRFSQPNQKDSALIAVFKKKIKRDADILIEFLKLDFITGPFLALRSAHGMRRESIAPH